MVLDKVDWTVGQGERWVILGPNGSGKTTLLTLAGARLWPSSGSVEILGSRLGRVDVRTLRPRIALVSGSVTRALRADLPARDVVVSGRHGALETWWHTYSDEDWAEADRLLEETGFAAIGTRPFGVISEGERQHVLLARALMSRPELLLLDEPAAGLDLGGPGALGLATRRAGRRPEQSPHGVGDPSLRGDPAWLHARRFGASGNAHGRRAHRERHHLVPLISACFDVAVTVGQRDGRWWSRAEQ